LSKLLIIRTPKGFMIAHTPPVLATMIISYIIIAKGLISIVVIDVLVVLLISGLLVELVD
jgi:hypothetical protein